MENFLDQMALIRQLIQPPKLTYNMINLGPPNFELSNKQFERIDFTVKTKDKLKLHCSLFYNKQQKSNKILIYIHCNNGSRVEAMQYAYKSLQMGYSFLCYDSRACGLSDGQYITLGFRQADDLGYIIRHTKNSILKQEINAYKFILWGRSMGAVTALRYMEKSSNCSQILCLVLDSPFINLKQVICQVGKKRAGIPHIFVDIAIKYIDPILKQRIGLVVQDFDFQKSIKCLRCPMILLASKNDGLIPQDHFVKIYDLHQGKKTVYYLDQVHTDCRHQSTVQKVFKSLLKYTNINDFKHNYDQKLMTYRSEFTTRRKSVSGKKLTVASKDIVTCRSNSSAKRKNIVTLKIMQQTQKQNKKSISLVSSRKMQTNQSPFISQFIIQKKREIKILNLRNFIDKKNTLKIY